MVAGALVFLVALHCRSTPPAPAPGKPEHHTATGFRNDPPVPSAAAKGPLFYLRRIWGSAFHPEILAGHQLSEKEAIAGLNALEGKNTLTWLGHSTFLFRINGKTILTDPFLTGRASPISFVGGVTRYARPGIRIENLPRIDIILISHNHYDHLDKHTLDALPDKERIQVGVPLGLKEFFINSGYKKVHELDWNESSDVEGLRITSLPAVHDSGRSLGEKDRTLWCSWAIEADAGRYFFGGDTGYSSVFQNIGRRYESFNLAILPIGAYEPRKVMWMSHVNPEEAIQLGKDVKTNVFVAGHWGTIELSDEPPWEPPVRFRKAARSAGIDQQRIWVMKIGETRVLP